ncbi:MAG TPA: CHRD domain-containing protein [Myxococcaceae bacterium]|nr:CHRD domain-containing protein [Myxococcaceae bacterium]
MKTATRIVSLSWIALLGCATEKPAATPAAPRTLQVALSPAAEPTPCPGAGPAAAGTATIVVAPDRSSISATVNYTGLSGDPTGSHIHFGPAGAAGPVVLPFAAPLGSPFSKTFTAADYVAAAGAPPDFAAFVTALEAGNAYVNVHTAACKPGEIRGQIR